MKTKILSLSMALLMLLTFTGCKGKDTTSSVISAPVSEIVSEVEESKYEINPLTGTEDLKKDAVLIKPVAIMINNIETAWGVQASLSKADVIYETFVEGGITRLLAVFKDVRTVGDNKIGSLRSGRYSYVDLAAGLGAQYVHAGLDEVYCTPHIAEAGITTVDLNTTASYTNRIGGNSFAFRAPNGLSYEHTLYTTGKQLYKGLKKTVGLKLKSKQDNFLNFCSEDSKYVPEGGACTSLYVPFSGSYSAEFKYNAETGTYDKYRYGATQKDYNDSKVVSVTNVLALYSEVYTFSDGYHVKTELNSGSGYYISNGGYKKVKWSKGGPNAPLKLTDENGKELVVNPGKTYICFTRNSLKDSTKIS